MYLKHILCLKYMQVGHKYSMADTEERNFDNFIWKRKFLLKISKIAQILDTIVLFTCKLTEEFLNIIKLFKFTKGNFKQIIFSKCLAFPFSKDIQQKLIRRWLPNFNLTIKLCLNYFYKIMISMTWLKFSLRIKFSVEISANK